VIDNYYTLRALVHEWRDALVGYWVGDAFSQVRDELTLALAGSEAPGDDAGDAPEAGGRDWMLRASVQRPLLYLFRIEGYSKARRNVATLFEDAFGRDVTGLRIAERDRLVSLDLADGSRFLWKMFGARANVFLVGPDDTILEAFRANDKHAGTEAPSPYPAPMPDTQAAFDDRWPTDRNTTRQALQSTMTLFGADLARETIHRAGGAPDDPADCGPETRAALFEAAQALRDRLRDPDPVVYGDGPFPDAFALVPLAHRDDAPAERFDTVDAAVSVFVKRALAEQHYHRLYDPVEEALSDAAEHYRRSAEQMMEELSSESRAGRYERWAHLLMAQKDRVPADAEEVTLPDLFEEGEPVTIPLDPARTAIENAEHYYGRARRTRRSREEAEDRLDDTIERAETAEALLEALRKVDTLDGIKRFRKKHEEELAPFVNDRDEEVDRFPFRRFDLGDGFEVWVGKNARQNQELTFHVAQKYDLWMHARGAPGSHTVLHLPNRDAQPGKRRLHTAASIAAYYSKARGSGVVPVMVTERKYVTSPKGAAPGQVTVQNEDVLLVEPGLP
jgi:predicted ribosome quality control (RQC) complex YloA/Tae2 family protein